MNNQKYFTFEITIITKITYNFENFQFQQFWKFLRHLKKFHIKITQQCQLYTIFRID